MKKLALLFLIMISIHSEAQQTIDLYSSTIPNSKPSETKEIELKKDGQFFGYKSVSRPNIKVYLPEEELSTGAAVIICPGGGYGMESYKLEGIRIAEAFNSRGIAAFVLKYRLPNDSIMIDKSIGPLQDAQQAMKIVRQRAAEWHLDPEKIGIMGFSAGGHLASTAGTHFNKSYIPNSEGISLRPSFMILIYPVISMKDELTHNGSRENLLGKSASEEQILNFSNELHIDSETPPTWLTHTGDDTVVPVENSIRFYQELIKNKIPSEMHLYPKGNHGFVLSIPTDEWMQPLFSWMKKSGIVNP
ncbi:alpha/beta hydrolase [Arenibacter echinorum]|uniref:Acetyl esterase/lipase n=1 Tax=Arenibacter echinorum TaxID=440515 RepID=A0A327R7X2_9FLAO|nr:alpha/beta hydrolase [Arenibacter echinorum]RAJ12245.1 acetyl esterase/lipase [Arenibacter echinorum]